jgi:hypothetical protein
MCSHVPAGPAILIQARSCTRTQTVWWLLECGRPFLKRAPASAEFCYRSGIWLHHLVYIHPWVYACKMTFICLQNLDTEQVYVIVR